MSAVPATCPVCRLAVFLAGVDVHPCCATARARGDADCGGCRGFEKRRREGQA